MKAALNGSLNLSILDGWWAEFYAGEIRLGASRRRMPLGTPTSATSLKPTRMYDLIEHQVAPRFYDHGGRGSQSAVPGALAAVDPAHARDAVARAVGRPHGAGVRRAALRAGGAGRARDHRSLVPGGPRALAAWKARVIAAVARRCT